MSFLKPKIMGVLNVTPDSFSDGNLFFRKEAAIIHAKKLIHEGVDILDIGAESTRPGSQSVDPKEQIRRLLPVLEGISNESVFISIDTQSAQVVEALLHFKISMINDVNALQSQDMLDVASKTFCDIVVMHMQGMPHNMQVNPDYQDVCDQVMSFFEKRIDACLKAGIKKKRIVLDPGIGFGKTLEHNLCLLRNLDQFKTFGCRILVGISKKSMIGDITGESIEKRIYGSLGGAIACALGGAEIIRAHDVKATLDAFDVFSKIYHQAIAS